MGVCACVHVHVPVHVHVHVCVCVCVCVYVCDFLTITTASSLGATTPVPVRLVQHLSPSKIGGLLDAFTGKWAGMTTLTAGINPIVYIHVYMYMYMYIYKCGLGRPRLAQASGIIYIYIYIYTDHAWHRQSGIIVVYIIVCVIVCIIVCNTREISEQIAPIIGLYFLSKSRYPYDLSLYLYIYIYIY